MAKRTRLVLALIGALACGMAIASRAQTGANDRALRARLVGTWRISSMVINGQADDLPQTSITLKHVTPAGFTWLSYKKGTDTVYRMAGGTYTLRGGTYTEAIQYGLGDDYNVIRNTKASFTCRIVGDTWYNKGKLANGTTIDEIWKRVKPGQG